MLANLYDFDKTVYPRDSGTDFFIYCLRKNPKLIKYLPKVAVSGIKFLMDFGDNDQNKSNLYCFVKGIFVQQLAKDFWDEHIDDIFPFFLPQNRKLPTVVCSASPVFLLKPICERLKVDVLIATEVDPRTGVIFGKNCKGHEKIVRIKKQLPEYEFENVYSDSIKHDKEILALGKRAFKATKGKLEEIDISTL
ncbi:MAG: HAD-IB family phosphatase [Clostridiales bacterium]|nr:HAD-IB family phosphatase [Clostridiales bacterium]